MAEARPQDARGGDLVSEDQEALAQRLAARGREQLVERLRPAFEQATATRQDTFALDPETLERMIQGAADRADGVLWRRSLAAAAREELGLELSEALIHPMLARAQELAGAPPYTPAATGADRHAPTAPTPAERAEPELTPDAIRFPAVHLGGVGNLSRGEASLELRFSDAGLDIVRTENSSTLGRIEWSEIEAIEVPRRRGRRRRRTRAQLLIRTARGEAHFEIPGVSESELRGYLEPLFLANRRD
jgi:hypothetical protein